MTEQITMTPAWGLLLMLALVAGVIWAVFALARGRGAGVVAGVLGGAAVLFAVGIVLVTLKMSRSVIVVGAEQTPRIAIPELDASAPPVSPAWLEADEYFIDADVYPSASAATRALTRLALVDVGKTTSSGGIPSAIVVVGPGHDPLRDVVAEIVRGHDPQWEVKFQELGDEGIGFNVYVTAAITGVAGKPVTSKAPESGTVVVTLGGPRSKIVKTGRFVSKPWVESFTAFVNQSPGERYILAQSQSPTTTAGEAERQAVEDAATQLTRHVQAAVERRWGRGRFVSPTGEHLPRSIHAMVQDAITMDTGMVADRFVQKFHRPAGDVYRALMLVKPDPAQIDKIAVAYVTQSHEQRRYHLSMAGSMAVLLVVLAGLYAFLNAATKGYYAAALRVAVVVGVVLGVGVLLLLV